MLKIADTIVAPITGNQPAAVAWIRLSGPQAWEIASKVFTPWNPQANVAQFGHYSFGDTGIALPFAEGRSFTGEETVELSIHGSTAGIRELLRGCVEAGARPAERGEFTLRAFLNGKVDLTQAESIRDTVEAQTQRQLNQALSQHSGELRDYLAGIRLGLTKLLAAVEASVDFSEEIGDFDRASGRAQLAEVRHRIESLLKTAGVGRLLREGARIALIGLPNVGKSSLLNALLGEDRAIVTPIAGTTRDRIEEALDIQGYKVRLVDTAGLREAEEEVERRGVELSRDAARQADLVWAIYDATETLPTDLAEFAAGLKCSFIWVGNKADLATPKEGIPVSAKTGEGLQNLCAESVKILFTQGETGIPIIEPRHAEHLEVAMKSVREAEAFIAQDLPADLLTVHLNEALEALGKVTGETATEDMLERIFSDFCIGK